MNMLEAQNHMQEGRAIRRAGWGGYWYLESDGTLCIALYDGTYLGRHENSGIDWSITVTHMAAEDWEVLDSIFNTEHYRNLMHPAGMPREAAIAYYGLGPDDLVRDI